MTDKDPNRSPPISTLAALTLGKPYPATHDMVINVYVTIPNLLPGITLRNKEAGTLRNASATSFPPKAVDKFELIEPIELEDVNNPGPVLATIHTFTAGVL
jgi:hypothetical protein